MPDTTDWLPLKQAADRLGVHSTTLRRWADNGDIPVMLTPGGHRRFTVADIERFAEEHRRLKMVAGLEQIWAEARLTVPSNLRAINSLPDPLCLRTDSIVASAE